MRERGFVSIGPNLAKSTSGHAGRLKGSTPPSAFPGYGTLLLDHAFHECLHIAMQDAAFGPLPCTSARSTPSSRANLRTEGLACGFARVSGSRAAPAACRESARAALPPRARGLPLRVWGLEPRASFSALLQGLPSTREPIWRNPTPCRRP